MFHQSVQWLRNTSTSLMCSLCYDLGIYWLLSSKYVNLGLYIAYHLATFYRCFQIFPRQSLHFHGTVIRSLVGVGNVHKHSISTAAFHSIYGKVHVSSALALSYCRAFGIICVRS